MSVAGNLTLRNVGYIKPGAAAPGKFMRVTNGQRHDGYPSYSANPGGNRKRLSFFFWRPVNFTTTEVGQPISDIYNNHIIWDSISLFWFSLLYPARRMAWAKN